MPTKTSDIDLIDASLRGNLTDRQFEEFEARMADEDFRKLLNEMKEAVDHVRLEGRKNLRAELRKWDVSGKNEAVRRTIRRRSLIGVAASIVMLIAAFFILNPGTDRRELALNYLEPYPNVISPIQKGENDGVSDYDAAFQFYEMGYYGKAEDAFRGLDAEDEAVQFYRALGAALDDKYQRAIDLFEPILKDPGHRFYDAACWYAALSHLMLDEVSEARLLLDRLSESNSKLRDQAVQVLDKL